MNLANKTILITGGASGIGLEAARQFLALGATVIVTGRNQAKLAAVKQAYPAITTIQNDVANPADAVALFDQVKKRGGIDILYHNAGVGVPPLNLGVANDSHIQGAAYEIEVNYLGVIRLTNRFMDMLKSRPESAIITKTSILSLVPSIVEATYSASKTALAFYTQSLRTHLQLIGSSVKVFELLPPLVDTDMVADREAKKMSPEKLVNALIAGLRNDQYTIRVGASKAVYLINRLFPKLANGLINPKKDHPLHNASFTRPEQQN